MSRRADRIAVVQDIIEAARNYKTNLVGKTFLFVFENQCVEAIFQKKHFKHLTGVESYLSANDFYKLATKGILRENQIWFSAKHPYDLCCRKLCHLKAISLLTTKDSFMLDEVITDSQSFKFGTTNMDFTLCFNYAKDEVGNIISTTIHAESLRDEDCFAKSLNVYSVTHVFSKPNNARYYKQIEFQDSKYSLYDLPDNIKQFIDEIILDAKT